MVKPDARTRCNSGPRCPQHPCRISSLRRGAISRCFLVPTMERPDQYPDIATLQAENTRLIALLEAHGIAWRLPPTPVTPPAVMESASLSTDKKIALFRKLFRGRSDVYPVRWESKTTGKSGYAPACGNEWRAGICEKPRIKCRDCGRRIEIQ